ncbi:MAG: flagellar basal body-associated FliL family protein [gamma proteobacterium symbiont of Bathyaustriella thionipta]|nr:flagellar basal body-associated FliL family protein [gamma proteobacterium symbiont of Bathyaustriella thionipta]MCU7951405.1 flagellar basal body-associated FliL family protein [gamma proteobacterium symbiont of Bathyaustriella thionipta]MCU7953129.1 flagellar basal body-associated FliL family protein [gamma proteobacterium symbiont of Bathyaustriella thionipta]MCU7957955.1 flagellar basal body-associated FliL family protein [gamma proteobacterium symbiont of Bathyaustriella thionipta]MCU79
MADEDLDLNGDNEEAPKSSKKMMIIIIAGVVLLLIVGVLGGMFFGGFFDDEPAPTETSQSVEGNSEVKADEETDLELSDISYWPLEPHFVLNFEGKSKARFMQIGLEVSTTNERSYAAVKKHLPVIRNEIVLLLSGQKYEEMVTPDGKEQLRAELIETINNILKKHKAKKGIDNIYFTSFVMQ